MTWQSLRAGQRKQSKKNETNKQGNPFSPVRAGSGHMNQPNINIMTKTYYVCDPTYEQQKVAPTNRRPTHHTTYTLISKKFQYNICRICVCFAVCPLRWWRNPFLPVDSVFPSTTQRENRSDWSTLSRTNNKSLAGAKFVLAACAIASPRCTTSATFILMRWSSSGECVQLRHWTTHINFSLISK